MISGTDVKKWTKPFVVGVKQPMEHWCMAVDKVRYVGEPLAIILASDRYKAEDAAELVDVEYEDIEPVLNISDAIMDNAPILHEKVKSNIVSKRHFNYGNVEKSFTFVKSRKKTLSGILFSAAELLSKMIILV